MDFVDDERGGLSLQLRECPILEVLVQKSVGKLLGERLYPLDGSVGHFDPDALLAVGAVTGGTAWDFDVLDMEADGVGYGGQPIEQTVRIVSCELVADGRRSLPSVELMSNMGTHLEPRITCCSLSFFSSLATL